MPTKIEMVKLNVGCGTDYRPGFINIDGSDQLPLVDKVIDVTTDRLTSHFAPESIDFILANDIVEHHFHWEAVALLEDFRELLVPGGTAEIRVPDAQYIIRSFRFSIETKLALLFGGQDVPQGVDPEMDLSRKQFPEYFCHKYGWTIDRMKSELAEVGFNAAICKRAGTNFITYATK